jgi:hypothetical protein
MEFTEKYGEICRGIDCTKIKSCKECKIAEKLNLCVAYEDTGLTPEETADLKEALETETLYSEYWKAQAMKSYEIIQELKVKNIKLHEALKGGEAK